MDRCFNELQSLRVICCASLLELPESIGNLKHLRYLEISRKCLFKGFPPSFCSLYNLQILYARKSEFQELPEGISKLINLQKLEAHFPKKMEADAKELGEQTGFITNFNPRIEELTIYNLGKISTDHAAELGLSRKKYLNNLSLRWGYRWGSSSPEHNQIEVLQALRPPTSIKSLYLIGYPGESLPSLLAANKNNGRIGTIFSSLADLTIGQCEYLSSLAKFLHAAFLPAIRKISITGCGSLKSLPVERLKYLASLEELKVHNCPNITHLFVRSLSLKTLELKNSGNLGDGIDCSSLTTLYLSCYPGASIKLQKWCIPVVHNLTISDCESLTSIRESEQVSIELSLGPTSSSTGKFPLLSQLTVEYFYKLETLDDLLTHEYLPAIKSIEFQSCASMSLPTERFGSFHFLKYLNISSCPHVNWQSGTVLPASLQKLTLHSCGDLSACFPSCLDNLPSLQHLDMGFCKGIVSIPCDLWRSNLISLQELSIWCFLDLESIGGLNAIQHIQVVRIKGCPKLKEVEQPLHRCN